MSVALVEETADDFGGTIMAIAAAEGSASHPYTHSFELNADPLATRNLADVLHLLSMLHGAQPGLIDRAALRNVAPEADAWFRGVVSGFSAERSYLAQLIVVAGPSPSTPGEAETAGAVLGQRHALETIAESDRFGCAIGAVAALLFDWQSIRAVLDTAAARIGINTPQCLMPDDEETAAMLNALPRTPRLDRALTFGARQLLIQHFGLWDLLETRAKARVG
jgi:hypothetical protein